ncbi:sensor histidine kinase [Agathobaculum sp.]|uniref:sensor histidine kinase n=1 Tax=Agathobaculum sp. TaxID=2048138 RepID=UPI00351FA7BC
MKAKRRTFGNFFVRVGTGFLAFWLVVMGAFTLLMGQQRAKLMLSEMENKAEFFDGDFGKYLLDSKQRGTDDTAQLRRALRWQCFRIDSKDPPNVQIVETAITDKNGAVLQGNRWWLTLRDGETDYDVDMGDQPQKVCEAILVGSAMTEELSAPFPEMTFEAWVDGDQAYLKSVTVRPTKEVSGSWEPTGEVNTFECVYDENRVKNLPLKTMRWASVSCPGPNDLAAKQLAASLTSPARLALREWAENPSGANSSEEIVRPWLVRKFQRTMKHCDFVDGSYVLMSYAAEGYPLKACLPILVPAGAISFTLAMLCAVILSFALLRVWRRQERVEQVRRETTAALAHELKTPLSVLSAAAELLEDNLAPEKQAHYFDVIQTQAQRMDDSVRKMLELSRLETGVQALRREEFPLAALAQERLAAALPADGSLHTELASDNEYMVNADRALLARALDALLENAVQHTPEGGCITVRIANGMLSVANTGDAIPNHALPRLWEAYYQADPSRSTKGDGLGLSIAKTVFDLHGYTCGAENTDAGPKFWFKFA